MTAYAQGKQAYIEGCNVSDCPYPHKCAWRYEWLRGWEEMEIEYMNWVMM